MASEKLLIDAGARWCADILIELLGSYAEKMPAMQRDMLRAAVSALLNYESCEIGEAKDGE